MSEVAEKDEDLTPEQQEKLEQMRELIRKRREANTPKDREPEIYGDVSLDIQAGSDVFSQPRRNDLGFGEYTHYQVRITREEPVLDDDGNETGEYETKAYKPGQVRGSLKPLDQLFNRDGLGAEIPKEQLNRLRINLAREVDSVDDIVIPDDGRLTSLPTTIVAKVKISKEVD